MRYTVEVTLRAAQPLTEDALFDVAELGGVAVGSPGGRHLETTLTVDAPDIRKASDQAIAAVTERVKGSVVALETMTTGEADRR